MDKSKTIILDCLGGDYGIEENATAASDILNKNPEISLVLVGPKSQLEEKLSSFSAKVLKRIHFEDCNDAFSSHRSATEVVKEGKASIVKCLQLLKEGKGDAVVSAGHTGAIFVSSLMVLGRSPGVNRPALSVMYPSQKGTTVLLDIGANIDCKPAHLVNFALMGCVYYANAFKKKRVSVGLLTIGEEDVKGSQAVLQAHQELDAFRSHPMIDYQGHVDGSQMFGEAPNVLVVDGFAGNLIVKALESLVSRFEWEFKKAFKKSSLLTKLGFMLSKRVWRTMKTGVDYQEIGGAPLLGVNGSVLVCHGRSDGATIAQAIRHIAALDLDAYQDELKKVLAESHDSE
jgi:phosphate acyltransferase